MSDERHPSKPAAEDPWARWRKPAAAQETEKPVAKPAEPVEDKSVEPPAGVSAEPAPETAAGRKTLSVKKVVKPAAPTGKPWAAAKENGPRGDRRPARPAAPSRPASPPSRPAAPPPRPAAPAPQGPKPEGVRLSKVMSERGMCSRREADAWIERGWVYVDGQRISELGTRIDPAAEISISQDAKRDQAKQVTVLLNKPVGYVSGQPEPGCTPAILLITAENQVKAPGDVDFKPWMLRSLAPAGRLDVDSTGLLVLTQDGRVAKTLIGDDTKVEKEYLVRVSGQMIPNGLELLNHGLELDGKPLKPARVKQLNEDQLHFILKEGKKRQIRRMCEMVGLRVTGLKRVRIGRVKLGDLPLGKWRMLREGEAF